MGSAGADAEEASGRRVRRTSRKEASPRSWVEKRVQPGGSGFCVSEWYPEENLALSLCALEGLRNCSPFQVAGLQCCF